jgi:hypothetical protein
VSTLRKTRCSRRDREGSGRRMASRAEAGCSLSDPLGPSGRRTTLADPNTDSLRPLAGGSFSLSAQLQQIRGRDHAGVFQQTTAPVFVRIRERRRRCPGPMVEADLPSLASSSAPLSSSISSDSSRRHSHLAADLGQLKDIPCHHGVPLGSSGRHGQGALTVASGRVSDAPLAAKPVDHLMP